MEKEKEKNKNKSNFEIRRKSFMYLAYVHVVFPTLPPVFAHPWTHSKLKPLSIPNQK